MPFLAMIPAQTLFEQGTQESSEVRTLGLLNFNQFQNFLVKLLFFLYFDVKEGEMGEKTEELP